MPERDVEPLPYVVKAYHSHLIQGCDSTLEV